MAVKVDVDALPEEGAGKSNETMVIPEGPNVARLVSYVEMGFHTPIFQGKPIKITEGKRAGEQKDDEFIIRLGFEFPAAEHTGDYPLTLWTSIPYGKGEFVNKLSLSRSLMEGTLSKQFAARAKYVKYLEAFKAATGTNHQSLDAFLDEPLIINVTHRKGKPGKDGTVPIYANMTPDGINKPEMKHPMTGKVEVFEVPPATGTYCKVFDWEAPTVEAWKAIPKFIQDVMKKATNFNGSALEAMLMDLPDDEKTDDKESDTTPPDNTGAPMKPGV